MTAGRDAIRAIRETGAAGGHYAIPEGVPLALVVGGDKAACREKGEGGGRPVPALHAEGHATGGGDGPGTRGGRYDHERYRSQQRSHGGEGVRQAENQGGEGH